MSKTIQAEVTCSRCDHNYDLVVYSSVNVTINPELKESVMTEAIFKSTCIHCDFMNYGVHDILYHDMDRKYMIYLSLPDHENVMFFQKGSLSIVSKFIGDDYTFRVVRYPYQLIEKIKALESEKDDRLIEFLKFYYKITHGENLETKHDFLHFDSWIGNTIEWVYRQDNGDVEQIEDTYDHNNHEFAKELIKLFTKLSDNGWWLIDWQFPLGKLIEDDLLITMPEKSEVRKIENGNKPIYLPKQVVDLM